MKIGSFSSITKSLNRTSPFKDATAAILFTSRIALLISSSVNSFVTSKPVYGLSPIDAATLAFTSASIVPVTPLASTDTFPLTLASNAIAYGFFSDFTPLSADNNNAFVTTFASLVSETVNT